MPVALGGTNDPYNLVAACGDCNSGKSAGLLPGRRKWRPLWADNGRGDRCPGDRHEAEWEEYPIGPEGFPGQDVALVCGACHFVVAIRPLATA